MNKKLIADLVNLVFGGTFCRKLAEAVRFPQIRCLSPRTGESEVVDSRREVGIFCCRDDFPYGTHEFLPLCQKAQNLASRGMTANAVSLTFGLLHVKLITLGQIGGNRRTLTLLNVPLEPREGRALSGRRDALMTGGAADAMCEEGGWWRVREPL